ncbi:hypothetical protein [Methanoculleus sp. UBA430]|uniref:hypothetical protein n=1 Tax=Methanoculleus sp. UBA430 TaxID=1915511 RepID=UPI00374458E9
MLKEERAPYGKRILSTLSKKLIAEYGPGHVAEYLTELPPRAVLEERLKAAISVARKQLEMRYDVDAGKSPKIGDE